MLKHALFTLAAITMVGCAAQRPMFIDMGDNQILRGDAAGMYGTDMTFSATNSNASLTCEGKFPRGSAKSVTGTIHCSNGQSGQYRLNTVNAKGGPYWRGEGTLENGQSFRIFINYLTDPDKN